MRNSYSIPTEKILERLRFENPWWKSKAIDRDIAQMPRRLYFDLFIPHVEDITLKRAIILMGPRRVGKTVMIQHAIHQLLENGIHPQKICFIGIDNPIYIHLGLEELYELARKASGNEDITGNYVFFDEIQYLKDWERHLKVLVDSYPKTKFIASGSAAAALRLKSSESGAGRFHDFLLPPLTFHEFLHLQDLQTLIRPHITLYKGKEFPFYSALDIKELNHQFLNYVNYGGYPEVIFSETIRQDMPRFIKNDIIDKVLLRDLPSLYGIRDVQELNRFFAYLAYHTGREFSLEKMAKESGLEKGLLKRYMEYLEAAFLIKVVHKVNDNSKHFKRVTGFKIYLTNPSLRTALFSPVTPTDDEIGNLVETAIFAQWMHRENIELYYAKWKNGRMAGEVDMIQIDEKKLKPYWCLEIKWSNRYFEKPNELKSLFEFCDKNNLSNAIVTTIDKEGTYTYSGIELNFYPASVYTYTVGANTIKIRQ
ncbi:MAG: ATP-binding protein [Bacteroidales bacterium]|nr:ATP-binding protein [Bacteroidales bacterium]MDT8430745.1 ATP-binding protein [Bacteroidales bacterium]